MIDCIDACMNAGMLLGMYMCMRHILENIHIVVEGLNIKRGDIRASNVPVMTVISESLHHISKAMTS